VSAPRVDPAAADAGDAVVETTGGTPVLDVAGLPTTVFGARDLTWWGTVGFMVTEGATLAVCAASYLYLRQHFSQWTTLSAPLAPLTLPTIGVALYLLSLAPMAWLSRAARRMDLRRTRIGLVIGSVLIVAFAVQRGLELDDLPLRWDANVYGSLLWTLLGFHGTLVLVEVAEVIGTTEIFFSRHLESKHFTDAADVAFYWYFLVASWLPLYALAYLLPRWR